MLEGSVAEDLHQNRKSCRILHVYEYHVPHQKDD